MTALLITLAALAALAVLLGRAVARDGLGTNDPPRSHVEEWGTWVDRELHR